MVNNIAPKLFEQLRTQLQGDLFTDKLQRVLYSTDASAYRERPVAVARPKTIEDIKNIIDFAHKNKTSIIPRTAGTSLAGQVVGEGIIVDVSKYMTQILELNVEERWITVQPGVIYDELNRYLKPHGLMFGPETSSGSRCMIGGMFGNNSCGLHSLVYGSVRDHTISAKTILSDGTEAEFQSLTVEEFENKCKLDSLEGSIYKKIKEILTHDKTAKNIRSEFPDKRLHRRNTGYAIDLLLETEPFTEGTEKFNFCKLLAGSEGTLAFTTEIKLGLLPLPPKEKMIVAAHFKTLEDTFKANLIGLKYKPTAIELMDSVIIECTKDNIEQQKNRFFIEGKPSAVLIIEFVGETVEELKNKAQAMETEMRGVELGYHFSHVFGADVSKVWNLRKAGLGLLSNLPGDSKPVSVIEDTAVLVEDLADYVADFKKILDFYKLSCVYHAHIATGELHLRPLLNLKDRLDVELFRTIAWRIAKLVKKYKGSLSGEHGDGRLRGEFIKLIIGDSNYAVLKMVKSSWDPNNVLNPGKIVNTPAMNKKLRYNHALKIPVIKTILDFSENNGIIRSAEKCNGSGDCLKTEYSGGTMCPSYMATRDEKHSTRARANAIREYLTTSPSDNPFNFKDLFEVMDLCLSCKACKAECPSNIDITKMKAEFLQRYYDANRIPLRTRLVANNATLNAIASKFPRISNYFMKNRSVMKLLKISGKRQLPAISKISFKKWFEKKSYEFTQYRNRKVYLFCDEFMNYTETDLGIKTIRLLNKLGYMVLIADHKESTRALISKGFLRKAKRIATENVKILRNYVTKDTPLISLEPSVVAAFRDEYIDLVDDDPMDEVNQNLKQQTKDLAANTFTVEEFLSDEIDKGLITPNMFSTEHREILYHGHCQQKALASTKQALKVMSLPENYTVKEIPSGCCGMAGSFGYEKEHYEVSMKIGELILFPAVREADPETIIAASGTSCRCQIKDGTDKIAMHPVEILFDAMLERETFFGETVYPETASTDDV